MKGQLHEANRLWLKALPLCKNSTLSDRMWHSLLTLLAGEPEIGLADIAEVIKDNHPGIGFLIGALKEVELVADCPNPPPGILDMLALLQAAIAERTG